MCCNRHSPCLLSGVHAYIHLPLGIKTNILIHSTVTAGSKQRKFECQTQSRPVCSVFKLRLCNLRRNNGTMKLAVLLLGVLAVAAAIPWPQPQPKPGMYDSWSLVSNILHVPQYLGALLLSSSPCHLSS